MKRDPIITTTTDPHADALTYWGVEAVDEPIRIVPFSCGRYICPNHQDETAAACEVTSSNSNCPQEVRRCPS